MTRERANEILSRWKAGVEWFDIRLINLALAYTGDLNENHISHS